MSDQITQILQQEPSSDRVDQLIPLVYEHMRNIAQNAIAGERIRECDPTELVHEAYIRLVGDFAISWQSRSHFFGACAVVIRRILVDAARSRKRQKRGGSMQQVELELSTLASFEKNLDVLALEDALCELADLSPRQARLVELRYFGGLVEQEAAEVLGVSRRTAAGDWAMARAWLRSKLADNGA